LIDGGDFDQNLSSSFSNAEDLQRQRFREREELYQFLHGFEKSSQEETKTKEEIIDEMQKRAPTIANENQEQSRSVFNRIYDQFVYMTQKGKD